MKSRYLIAIDPSLTCSGWALFNTGNTKVAAYGDITPPGPSLPLEFRLSDLQNKVTELFTKLELGATDFLVAEGPATLVKNPISSMKLEQVRSLFEVQARSFEINILDRINPRTVQQEILLMRGPQASRKEVKQQARLAAEKLYPEVFKTSKKVKQDIIDALLVGTVAINKFNREALCYSP